MNKRTFLLISGLGAGLVACGEKDQVEDEEVEVVSTPDLPPAPELPGATGEHPGLPPGGDLPTWDEVKSGHPEGATNPPMPELIVTPDGYCYKHFRPGMLAPQPGEAYGDRVQECGPDVDCGTPIQCPEERVAELMGATSNPPPPEDEAPPETPPE